MQYFFDGAPGVSAGGQTPQILDFIGTVEGLQLNTAFTKIKHDETRRLIVELVKTLSEAEPSDVRA